jgi:hypothetical protein
MQLTQAVLTLNWKYALSEIALIAIGISIALYADAWYEERADRKEEVLLLTQMLKSLERDRVNLDRVVEYYEHKGEILMGLEAHLLAKRPYSKDLRSAFGELKYFNWVDPSTGVYETLKSQRLDLVSNPQVRLSVVSYYDIVAANVTRRNNMSWDDLRTTVEPFYGEHFRFVESSASQANWGTGRDVDPIDYEEIVAGDRFQYILSQQILVNQAFRTPTYKSALAATDKLVETLREHLHSLGVD